MIYRVSLRDSRGEQLGYLFAGSRKIAEKMAVSRQEICLDTEIEEIATPKNKEELLKLLRRVAAHPDNG